MPIEDQSSIALAISLIIIAGIAVLAGSILRGRKNGMRLFAFAGNMAGTAWPAKDACMVIVTLMLLQLLIASGLSLINHFFLWHPPIWVLLVIQGLCFHGIGGILLLLAWKGHPHHSLPGMHNGPRLQHIGQGLLYYVAAAPVVWAGSLLSNLILRDIEPQSIINVMLQAELPWQAELFAILLAVLVAPVVEETLFRGLLLPVAIRHFGKPLPAVILVSFAFAAIHGHLPSILPLTILGIFFSFSLLKTGSLYPAIAMHAAFNAVTILLVMWARTIPGMLQN